MSLAVDAYAQDRYALVVGNAAYGDTTLVTPPNNAAMIRDRLFDLGYQVTLERDLSAEGLRDALRRFGSRLQRGADSIGIFYYTGLAAQVRGTNYLVPVNVRLQHANELPMKGVELGEVIAQMQQGSALGRVIILDASPHGTDVIPPDVHPGLAATRAPPGFLLAFAAMPDRTAILPRNHTSLYAQALAEALREHGLPAEALFSRVRRVVADRTSQQQQTWHQSALSRPLIVNTLSAGDSLAPRSAELESAFWERVRTSAAGLESYLKRYPLGTYADEARRMLRSRVPAAVNVLGSGTVFRDCPQCPELVVVEPGSFEMGSSTGQDNEQPVHHVTISEGLAVGRYEVSFREWDACVEDRGCSFSPPDKGWGRDRRPVIFVSWQDAHQYVQWLSAKTGERYRLPTEAEWEYFARAGTRGDYPWGNEIGRGNANCFGCRIEQAEEQTLPVGRFTPNAFGLFDVIGNVWEWVEDCYADSYERAAMDGRAEQRGHCVYRVFRGGSWYDQPERVRVSFRNGGQANLRSVYVGFRVVREMN